MARVLALVLAGSCGWSVYAISTLLQHRAALSFIWGAWLWVLVVALAAAAALSGVGTVRAMRGAGPPSWPRGLFCAAVLGAVVYIAWVQPFARLTFDVALGLCGGVFALQVIVRPRFPRVLQIAVFNLCMLVVLGELGLRGLAAISPSPLLSPADAAILERLHAHRYPAGKVRWGFACNDAGHFDGPFLPRAERDGRKAVAMIGDSFSTGVVPHPFHFTTVCERGLDGVDVYNVGVSATGPLHYLHLLRTEVLPLEPEVVVVNLFVGNDVTRFVRRQTSVLRRWLDRDNVLLWVFPQRLIAVARESRAQGRDALVLGAPQGETAFGEELIDDVDELRARMPWLRDPSLQEPTFSEPVFVQIETGRARGVCLDRTPHYDWLLEVVEEMRRAAGDAVFAVVLIPDEFQVEDELWEKVVAASPDPLDRDLPQRILIEELATRGIPTLDLLPAMRAAPVRPDGRRHLYHLRDTHFGLEGNRVAGEAMARFLKELL